MSSWVATYVCCSRGRSITLQRGSSSPALRILPRCYSLHKVIHYTRCSAHPPQQCLLLSFATAVPADCRMCLALMAADTCNKPCNAPHRPPASPQTSQDTGITAGKDTCRDGPGTPGMLPYTSSLLPEKAPEFIFLPSGLQGPRRFSAAPEPSGDEASRIMLGTGHPCLRFRGGGETGKCTS